MKANYFKLFHEVYVGDLNDTITESQLTRAFSEKYNSIVRAKLIKENTLKKVKTYAFVDFSDEKDSKRAVVEMKNARIGDCVIKTGQSYRKEYSNVKK